MWDQAQWLVLEQAGIKVQAFENLIPKPASGFYMVWTSLVQNLMLEGYLDKVSLLEHPEIQTMVKFTFLGRFDNDSLATQDVSDKTIRRNLVI